MTTWTKRMLGGAALACLTLASWPAGATGYSLFSVRGSYGYTLEGTVGDDATSYVEAGRIVADGSGRLTTEGTAIVGGTNVIATSFACTYTVSRTGILEATCTAGRSRAQFRGPIVDGGRELSFVAIPQDGSPESLVGRARKQSNSPF
ncbi:MAG: hypothetical protein U1E14_20655 [Geminicoccaceae bacterium]